MATRDFTEIQAPPSSASRGLARAERGARLPSFCGLPDGVDLQDLLDLLDAWIVVIFGTGSVGANIAHHLARLGIRELRLCDRGAFKSVSLSTQPVFPHQVGRRKASSIGRDCKRISPGTRVLAFDGDLESLSLASLAGAHLAFLATDNLHAEVASGDRCSKLGIPLVQASVHGGTLVAQVRFFGNSAASSPCPACGFGPGEMARLGAEAIFSCEGAASSSSLPQIHSAPTMSVSPLCSLAADLAVLQALKSLFRLGSSPADSALEFCAYTGKTAISPLRGNPACPCEHVRFERRELPAALDASTPSQLVAACGFPPATGSAGFSLAIDGLVFVESGACKCSTSVPVRCFAPAGAGSAGLCPQCGSSISPAPFFTHPSLGGSLFAALRDRPLASLGVRADDSAAVVRSRDSGAVLLHPGGGSPCPGPSPGASASPSPSPSTNPHARATGSAKESS
jgi:molybdopterin/thiamine biosynthesis adenylyltransferase